MADIYKVALQTAARVNRMSAFERTAARTAAHLARMQRDANRASAFERSSARTAARLAHMQRDANRMMATRRDIERLRARQRDVERVRALQREAQRIAHAREGLAGIATGLPEVGGVSLADALTSAPVLDGFSGAGSARAFVRSTVGAAHLAAAHRVLETWWFVASWGDLAHEFFAAFGERIWQRFDMLLRRGELWVSVRFSRPFSCHHEPLERGSSAAVRTSPDQPNAPPRALFRERDAGEVIAA